MKAERKLVEKKDWSVPYGCYKKTQHKRVLKTTESHFLGETFRGQKWKWYHLAEKHTLQRLGRSLFMKVKLFSCIWHCDPMDCSPPGSSFHGSFQARILEWVVISFSRSSWPRDWTQVSSIVGRRFTIWATREVWS